MRGPSCMAAFLGAASSELDRGLTIPQAGDRPGLARCTTSSASHTEDHLPRLPSSLAATLRMGGQLLPALQASPDRGFAVPTPGGERQHQPLRRSFAQDVPTMSSIAATDGIRPRAQGAGRSQGELPPLHSQT